MMDKLREVITIKESKHSSPPTFPYAVYGDNIETNVFSNGEISIEKHNISLDVYMLSIDKNLLEQIEGILKEHDINFSRDEIEWLATEKSYVAYYDFFYFVK